MSSPQELAFGLIAGGALCAVSMLVYIQACRWATTDLIPAARRRRVRRWRRVAPRLIVVSVILIAIGLTLALTAPEGVVLADLGCTVATSHPPGVDVPA